MAAGGSAIRPGPVPTVMQKQDCTMNFKAHWPHGYIQPRRVPGKAPIQLGFTSVLTATSSYFEPFKCVPGWFYVVLFLKQTWLHSHHA